MSTMTSQVTSTTIVYSTVYSVADQGKHQGSASLAFMMGIHRWPVNSPHKWSVTRKMFPFDDVIMRSSNLVPPSNCNLSEDRYTEMNTDLQRKLTHWGRATHICVSKLTIIASDNGLSPGRRQAIIWNNAGILSIGLLGTKFIEILIEILTFSFKQIRLKVSSAKWRSFCFGLNVLSDLTRALPAGGVGGGTTVIVQTKVDRRHAPSKEVTWDCYWL